MITTDDYYNATPDERARLIPRTPTHRGEPRNWALAGYAAAKTKTTPRTHRGEPRA